MFDTEVAKISRCETKQIAFDSSKKIAKLHIASFLQDSFVGFKLEDDKGEIILDLPWANWTHSEWTTYDIPDGQEIIGLKLRHSNYEKI